LPYCCQTDDECEDNNPCTIDSCNPNSLSCTYQNDSSCKVWCTDPEACNYDPSATIADNDLCIKPEAACCDATVACSASECPLDTNGAAPWCTDPDPQPILWCTDSQACNYNPQATQDDGSCYQWVLCCNNTYQCEAKNCAPDYNAAAAWCGEQEVLWCTDNAACNYNPQANQEDGSCKISDCQWICGWNAIEDACGICAGDNSTCTDCAWNVNGWFEVDACGNCKNTTDPSFGQWCVDCAWVVNGSSYEDECGVCDALSTNDGESCKDCAGVVNGTAVVDGCGICGWDNSACKDCAWTINGVHELDACGTCLDPSDPSFGQWCVDCAWVPNGWAVIDACKVCNGWVTQQDLVASQVCGELCLITDACGTKIECPCDAEHKATKTASLYGSQVTFEIEIEFGKWSPDELRTFTILDTLLPWNNGDVYIGEATVTYEGNTRTVPFEPGGEVLEFSINEYAPGEWWSMTIVVVAETVQWWDNELCNEVSVFDGDELVASANACDVWVNLELEKTHETSRNPNGGFDSYPDNLQTPEYTLYSGDWIVYTVTAEVLESWDAWDLLIDDTPDPEIRLIEYLWGNHPGTVDSWDNWNGVWDGWSINYSPTSVQRLGEGLYPIGTVVQLHFMAEFDGDLDGNGQACNIVTANGEEEGEAGPVEYCLPVWLCGEQQCKAEITHTDTVRDLSEDGSTLTLTAECLVQWTCGLSKKEIMSGTITDKWSETLTITKEFDDDGNVTKRLIQIPKKDDMNVSCTDRETIDLMTTNLAWYINEYYQYIRDLEITEDEVSYTRRCGEPFMMCESDCAWWWVLQTWSVWDNTEWEWFDQMLEPFDADMEWDKPTNDNFVCHTCPEVNDCTWTQVLIAWACCDDGNNNGVCCEDDDDEICPGCEGDGVCNPACAPWEDPDCEDCSQDGVCNPACDDDPDCFWDEDDHDVATIFVENCSADGMCNEDCPAWIDPDCACAADGVCNLECALWEDPDCGADCNETLGECETADPGEYGTAW